MSTFLSKIMDSAQDVRVFDSNERLNEYIQGVLRKSDLESFVAVAPRHDGYRVYVGEGMENPFAYVDVYLDGEALVVEGSSKRHLSDAEMGDLARFLGINGKEAGEKLNRFRKFVDLLRSESGKSVDDLKDARVSDSVETDWVLKLRQRLAAIEMPSGKGDNDEEEDKYYQLRFDTIMSSVVVLLNGLNFKAVCKGGRIEVEGTDGRAVIVTRSSKAADDTLLITVTHGDTKRFPLMSADEWVGFLKESIGNYVYDSAEGGRYKVWVDSESHKELPKGFKAYYDDVDSAYDAAAEFVHKFDGKPYRVIAHVEDLELEETVETVESFIDEESSDTIISDDEMLAMLREDSSPKMLSRVANILEAQGRTSLKDGNREILAIAEYPNGVLVYSFKQRAWQEAVEDSCKKVKDAEDVDIDEDIVKGSSEGITEESLNEEIRKAGEETKVDLTEEEKQSGDYPKGVVEVQGMSVVIENPKGSVRSGVDADGNEWSTEMQDTYGYFEGTAGADTDDIDVFVGEHPLSDKVFIVDQVKEDGSFDEHKVMFGYESSEEAREAYLRNYDDDWQGLGSITQVGVEDFRRWVEADKTRDKAFTEYIKVQDSNVRPQDFGQTHRIKVDGVYYTNGNTITVDGKQGRVTRFGEDYADVRFDDGSTIKVKGEVTKIPDSMTEGGVSTTKSGEEKYEKFTTRVGRKSRTMYQYDYRTPEGELFSCVAPSLESCRMKRDAWLEKRGLKVLDTMAPNEDKDENIHINWKASDLEKHLHKPVSMQRSKKVEDSKERISFDEIERSMVSTDSMPSFIKLGSRKYTKTGKDEWTGAKTARADESKYTDRQMYDKVQAAVILEVPISEELSMRTIDSSPKKYWAISFDFSTSPTLHLLGRRSEQEVDELLSRGDITVYPFMFPSKQSYDFMVAQGSGPKFGYEIDRSLEVLDVKDDFGSDSFLEVEVLVSYAKKFKDMLLDLRHLQYSEEASNVFHFHTADDDDALLELRNDLYEYMDAYSIPRDAVFLNISDVVEDSDDLPRRDFVFPADSTTVNDGKGHFPLNSIDRGRAALAFVARYDKLPKWYSGDMSLEEFKGHVRSEVKKAYPSIEVSDSAESGSDSFDFNGIYLDLHKALLKLVTFFGPTESVNEMTDAEKDMAEASISISRAMRYLHKAARKQGQTTDFPGL